MARGIAIETLNLKGSPILWRKEDSKVKYQCEHIQHMIDTGRIDIKDIKDSEGGAVRKGVPIIHEVHKDGDYMTTRERDRWIECIYCPTCGVLVDAEKAAEIIRSEKGLDIWKRRQSVENQPLSFCGYCNEDIRPTAVAIKGRRRGFMYLCPICGGQVRRGMARRTIDTVAGVIQGPGRGDR